MQTDSKYNIRTQYVSFLNPKSTKTEPNVTLRTFILDWVKDGKELSGSLIAREYTKKTGSSVTRQRVEALIKQLGAKTLRKIRNGVLILMLMGSLAAAQLSLRPATELALQIPQVRQWVYPQKAYAVEPSISISVPEGVVEIAQVASTSAGQTLPTPTPSVSNKEEVMAYIVEVFGDDADRAIWMAKCESGLRKDAYNGSNRNGTADYGVFQINSVHIKTYGDEFTTDWKTNVEVAHKIFKAHGNSFRPWVCAKSIGEKNYLGK